MKPVGENKEVDKICCCVLLTRVYFKKKLKIIKAKKLKKIIFVKK